MKTYDNFPLSIVVKLTKYPLKSQKVKTYDHNFSLSIIVKLTKYFYWHLTKWKHMTTTFHCSLLWSLYKLDIFYSIDILESENMWPRLSIFFLSSITTPQVEKMVTGVQVVTASQVQSIRCRWSLLWEAIYPCLRGRLQTKITSLWCLGGRGG